MERVALIRRRGKSDWVSCQSITENLFQCYKQVYAGSRIEEFFLDCEMSRFDVFQLAGKVKAFSPGVVVFLDHAPHPEWLIRALYECDHQNPLPRLIIHAFGDFALHSDAWIRLSNILSSADVKFVCASPKHRDLISSFLTASSASTSYVPFALDTDFFSFSPEIRMKSREHIKCSHQDWVFCYAGRLSFQKNVLALITAFSTYLRQFNPDAQLWLAGPIDDLGVPYLGKHPVAGSMSHDLLKMIDGCLPRGARGRVRYFGNLGIEPLRELHHASDCFVSLSAHNDEDFGMAPAEAACSGSPLILSDWGGYTAFAALNRDFSESQAPVQNVPLSIGETSVAPRTVDCLRAMMRASSRPWTDSDRVAISRAARNQFSRATVAKLLAESVSQSAKGTFNGFSPLFHQVASAFRVSAKAPFRRGEIFSQLYREVYGSYA